MPSSPRRLAFTYISRRVWAGGFNYLNNLFVCLDAHQSGRFVPIVFAESGADAEELAEIARLPSVEVVRSSAFDRKKRGLASAIILGRDREALAEFRRHRVDVVIETARFFGWRLPYPAVAWFPDLQHRRLPQLFSFAARNRRELGFRMQIASGRTVMVSSEDARRDCLEFYPSLGDRIRVVRFATRIPSEMLSDSSEDIRRHYRLPQCFFYLPNQFWKHKNHQLVIDALKMVRARNADVVVAVSGNPGDDRYFRDVMKQVEEHDLQAEVRYLGMIPRSHVYGLLRGTAALLNPSAFEGWSSTVEEAKSFGTPMILSDIAVHREQASTNALYFDADDPSMLADLLVAAAAGFVSSVNRMPVLDVEARAAAFAADFTAAIDFACPAEDI